MKKLTSGNLLIPAVTLFVAGLGTWFTAQGMDWYNTVLIQPKITPPDWVFSVVWSSIYVLTTISALLLWNKTKEWDFMFLYLMNAVLNVAWTFIFFRLHLLEFAFFEIILLEINLVVLMMMTWKTSKTVSLLLTPYTLWVAFASVITYLVMELN